jgi:hypothetical protein
MMNEAYRPMKLRPENDNDGPMTVDEADIARRETEMSFAVAEELLKHYPGHPWTVKVKLWRDENRTLPGGAMISIPVLMPEGKGYNIPLLMLRDANSFVRNIKEAGGHILERYQLPRSGVNFDRLLAVKPTRRLTFRDKVPA